MVSIDRAISANDLRPGPSPHPHLMKCLGVFIVVTVVLSSRGVAFDEVGPPRPSDYDKRVPIQPSRDRIESRTQASGALINKLPGVKLEWDRVTGAPGLIVHPRQYLVEKNSVEALTSGPNVISPVAKHRPTRLFLQEQRDLFGFGAEILEKAKIRREARTAHNGLTTVVWEQQLEGIPIFGGLLTSHTTDAGALVCLSSHFIELPKPPDPSAPGAANQSSSEPRLTGGHAVMLAARDLGLNVNEETISSQVVLASSQQRSRYLAPELGAETVAGLVWLPINAEQIRLCWEVILTSQSRMFRILIDADSGQAWLRQCLTEDITEATFRVFTKESPSPFSPAHDGPSTIQPPTVARELVRIAALDTNASPQGWINDGDNQLAGNNADVYTDRDASDSPDLPRAQGSPARTFDFPLDLARHPTNSSAAAVVQVFYWCNWMHDQLYGLGFTEAAGNFQQQNFGRGGLGNDAVRAEAQDKEGFANANFSTPPDGMPGRMQLFLFPDPYPDRDCSLDAEVILHEYTHGLSNRRVGGGIGISALQSRGMGEGWSDYMSLALLRESEDDVDGVYAMGGYSTYLLGHAENYYYGIRRYPYCTDTNKNPLTFKDIDPTQISSHPGVPRNPRTTFSTNEAFAVHRQGEVWCTILWEVRANLVRKHGYPLGHRLALQLVVDGMTLSPQNPTFLQARDAIILADRVNNGGANFHALWAGFAKRGLGLSASCPPNSTTTGVIEAFDLPDTLSITPPTTWTVRRRVNGSFEPAERRLTIYNAGQEVLPWRAVPTATWLSIANSSGTLPVGNAPTEVMVRVNETALLFPPGRYVAEVLLINESNQRVHTNRVTLEIDSPDFLVENFNDSRDNTLDFKTFTFTPETSAAGYSVCRNPATALPVNPAGGTAFGSGAITLPQGRTVQLFGVRYSSLYANREGSVSFGAAGGSAPWIFENHFEVPCVSGLRSLYEGVITSSSVGTRTWKILQDRFVASFENLSGYALDNNNTFQIEMFYDGRIRLTYLNIDIRDGMVGLSRGGGIPAGFVEADFDAYPQCHSGLELSLPLTLTEGAPAALGSVRRPRVEPVPLLVTLTSSLPEKILLPTSVVIPAFETSASFEIILPNDAEADGPQPCRISATAAGVSAGQAVVFVGDNDVGTLALILPEAISEAESAAGMVQLGASSTRNVVVHLRSSLHGYLETDAFVILPPGEMSASFQIRAVDNPRIEAARPISVTAEVSGWPSAFASVQVLDDDPATLAVVLPTGASETAGTLTNLGLVHLTGTWPALLIVSLTSSDPAVVSVPSTVAISIGESSASFPITVHNDALETGPRTVTIRASKADWSDGVAKIIVHDDEWTPVPALLEPPHQSVQQLTAVRLSWDIGSGERIVNGDFETGDFTGWRKVAFSNDPDGGGVYTRYVINDGSYDPRPDSLSAPAPSTPMFGRYEALGIVVGCNSGLAQLSQDVTLPANASSATLSWYDKIKHSIESISSTQSYRVEIRTTNDVLRETLFVTGPGFPQMSPWTSRVFPLTRYLGETIRVVWSQEYHCYPIFTYLDNISLMVNLAGPTAFEVYLGKSPELESSDYLGTTTAAYWQLEGLERFTTYYWQVVVRNGTSTQSGPVWQFRTGSGATLDRFSWGTLPPFQVVEDPFEVEITARDSEGQAFSNFVGKVSISAFTRTDGNRLVSDNFDAGNFNRWGTEGPPTSGVSRQVTSSTSVSGSRSLTIIGGNQAHDTGLVRDFLTYGLRPDRIDFFIRTAATNKSGGYLKVGAEQNSPLGACALFYMSAGGKMGLFQPDRGLIGTNYVANRWYGISLRFDWARRRVSAMADGQLIAASLPFGPDFSVLPAASSIHLYNFDNTQTWWDDIVVEDGYVRAPVALQPNTSAAFTNGSWAGPIYMREPVEEVWLTADDGQGHQGTTDLLRVLSNRDSDQDALPDAWENIFFGSPGSTLSQPGLDADGDGSTNLEEYQAGTFPDYAESVLRILGISTSEEGIQIEFSSAAGKAYVLERSLDVAGGLWSPVTERIVGNGDPLLVTDSINAEATFYRVRLDR